MIRKIVVTPRVTISVTGTAMKIPFRPKINGSKRIMPASMSNVRRNEMAAEILPLQREVKKQEPKMLKPQKRKAMEKIWNPFVVMASKVASPLQKISVTGPAAICAAITVKMDVTAIIFMQRRKRFCSSSLFCAP